MGFSRIFVLIFKVLLKKSKISIENSKNLKIIRF